MWGYRGVGVVSVFYGKDCFGTNWDENHSKGRTIC
jgi:hypothetical protein